jgi:hypothetical protein
MYVYFSSGGREARKVPYWGTGRAELESLMLKLRNGQTPTRSKIPRRRDPHPTATQTEHNDDNLFQEAVKSIQD